MGFDSSVGALPQGTVARIYENSLSGIANKYVVLEPGSSAAAPIPNGGRDQLGPHVLAGQPRRSCSTPSTRSRGRGCASSSAVRPRAIEGKAPRPTGRSCTSHRGWPARATSRRDRPRRAGVRRSARARRAGAAGACVASAPAHAARREHERDDGRDRAARARRSSRRCRCCADTQPLDLDVRGAALDARRARAAGRASRNRRCGACAEFATALRQLTNLSIPTVGQLNALDPQPAGTGDLTTLLQETPGLARGSRRRRSRGMIKEMNDSQHQLDYLREYTPDVVAALTNLGQVGAYLRRQRPLRAHAAVVQRVWPRRRKPADVAAALAALPGPAASASDRCPGGAVQPAPDGSAPWPCRAAAKRTPRRAREATRRHPRRAASRRRSATAVASSSSAATRSPYQVRAIFDDAAFAVSGEDVRIAGAPTSASIQSLDVCTKAPCPVGSPAEQGRGHDPDQRTGFTPFHANAHCAIRPQSLIGEKYVDCTPGHRRRPRSQKIDAAARARGRTCCRSPARARRSTRDIVQDISQQPVRAVASRSSSTSSAPASPRAARTSTTVIHRANPALGQTDKVFKILARQNRTLAQLATDSDAVLAPLARAKRAARRTSSSRRTRRRSRARRAPPTSRARSSCSRRSCSSCGRSSPTSGSSPTRARR